MSESTVKFLWDSHESTNPKVNTLDLQKIDGWENYVFIKD